MTQAEIHNAIRARFDTQVADVLDLTTIYDNDPTPAPTDNSMWCRLTILGGQSRRVTLGTKEYRTPGVVIVQLFGPLDRGDSELLTAADSIVTAFRSVQITGIRFEGEAGEVASPQRMGVNESQYQINVEIPFVAGDLIA